VVEMTNTILNKQSLPETLFKLINTDRVLLQERDGEIRIFPLHGEKQVPDALIDGVIPKDSSKPIMSREEVFGCMRGQFKMSDDFDEPLEDFKEYM
jgi:hypothetical protein